MSARGWLLFALVCATGTVVGVRQARAAIDGDAEHYRTVILNAWEAYNRLDRQMDELEAAHARERASWRA